MDLRTKDGYGTKQPRGAATTLLDLVSRDDQDNTLFPTTANVSRFIRDEGLRTVPMSAVYREFTFKGPAEFGQTFIFDLNHKSCGDLIQGLFIQVRLADWLPAFDRERLKSGEYKVDSILSDWWTYVNSLGTVLLNEATLEVDDQVLERITGDACNVVSTLFPDLNTQLGVADVIGRQSMQDLLAMDGTLALPTDDMWITVPLCFSMLRERLTATFPLIACREGTIRIRVSLKRFDQIVRNVKNIKKCNELPIDRTYNIFDMRFPNRGAIPILSKALTNIPEMRDIRLLSHGIFVDGPYHEMLLRQPFERPFREIQQFDFNEPLKYVVNKSGNDSITIQLPLEANQPIEEIVWFLRRKAAVDENNDWINYSATLEKDYDAIFAPPEPLLISAKIQGNGMEIISQDEAWFRSHISRAHKGGKVAYDSFIYGYSFAKSPAEHNPTGSINASRLSSLRLILDVKPPSVTAETTDTEWEVHVFVFAFQWLRFGNGLCNKVFID